MPSGTLLTKVEVAERNKRLLAMYFENHTLEEVSEKYGMTRERVRQIINLMGYQPRRSTNITRETLSIDRKFRLSSAQLFWSGVSISDPDKCWEWQGARFDSGYGRVGFGYLNRYFQLRYCHRIAYAFAHRKIPKLNILHSCDNPPCCNPNHLREGTQADNIRDLMERHYDSWYEKLVQGRQRSTTRPIKYNQAQVKEWKRLRDKGLTFDAISSRTNTPLRTICAVLAGDIKIYKKFLESV